jgi:hypothetical protein
VSGEGLIERLRTGDPRKCPFPDIDLEAAQPCPVCGDMGTLPGDPGHVDAPVRCVKRNYRLLIDEAATALTTAEARIQELEAALSGAVRAMEAEATVLRTAGYAPSCAEALTRKAKIAREIIARRTLRGE